MRLWIDDVRPAPANYIGVQRVQDAIKEIMSWEMRKDSLHIEFILGHISMNYLNKMLAHCTIEEIACDNDLGENELEGYKLLDWLEVTNRNYPIRILTDNPVARQRMRAIIERNGWKEIV